ncbi:Cilia- and flagella-associated protein 45 [Entophlyctis luteolus]|nr:Cilia- and flagella-associated protein 45 [Entophlyctis luteolus]
MSKEELQEYNHELNNQRILAAETAKARKAKMEEYDHKRSANAKLSALEQETKDKSNYLLAKAQMQLEEQEDEIKHMNELMLYAKCVAIRDAQVEEKKMIARERKEEDARLDAMMEIERVNELKKLEEREKRRIEELRKGAAKIREQIEERREAALLEQERRDQETKQILKAIADMNEQDKAEKLQKIKMQRIMMLDVAKANQESTERRRQMKIAEEEEDKKVLQYILDKEQREIEKDRIMQQKKAEREIELARLRAAQEKMSDKQAQQDALRAQRAYEAYEREWRRKEKETAEKHKLQEDELKAERIKQQRAREHAIAVEARKMKDEFFENLRRQKETEERIKAEEALKHNKNRLYSTEVQAQIRQKEALKKKQREEFFMEGVRLSQERLDKTNKIDQIKDRKIQELRNIGVPQNFMNQEQMLQLPPDNGGVDNCMERDPNSSHSEYGAIGDLLPAPMQMHDMHMQMYNIPQFLPQQAVFDSHGLSPIHQHIAQQRQHQHQLPFNGHTRDYDHNYANHQEHDGLPMYSDNPFFFNHHHNHSYHSQEMNQIQIQNPYMDTMHLHFNHSLVNPHQRSHFGLPQPEFGAFAPVAMNLIEGSAVRTADGDEPEGNFVFTTTDTQAPDSPRHTHHAVPQGNGPASAGGSFPTHSAMSPRSTLAMRGLTQIDANGTMMRLEKRPDSPNAWAWVPAETDRYPPTVAADSGAASGRGHAAPAADHPNCSAFYECHRALARDVSAEDGPRFDSSSALRHETESFGNSTFCGNDGRSFKKNAAHQFCDMLQLQLVSDNDLEAMAASTAALATGAAYVTSKVGGMAMNDESDDNVDITGNENNGGMAGSLMHADQSHQNPSLFYESHSHHHTSTGSSQIYGANEHNGFQEYIINSGPPASFENYRSFSGGQSFPYTAAKQRLSTPQPTRRGSPEISKISAFQVDSLAVEVHGESGQVVLAETRPLLQSTVRSMTSAISPVELSPTIVNPALTSVSRPIIVHTKSPPCHLPAIIPPIVAPPKNSDKPAVESSRELKKLEGSWSVCKRTGISTGEEDGTEAEEAAETMVSILSKYELRSNAPRESRSKHEGITSSNKNNNSIIKNQQPEFVYSLIDGARKGPVVGKRSKKGAGNRMQSNSNSNSKDGFAEDGEADGRGDGDRGKDGGDM